MGLDMYFKAKRCNEKAERPRELEAFDKLVSGHFNGTYVYESFTIGYFRKFNALHALIVDKYADGIDDCQEIYLSRHDIQEILGILVQVYENHELADKLLPTQSGFFFGCTEYDDWYFNDVQDAIELFQEIVQFDKPYDIIYQASW